MKTKEAIEILKEHDVIHPKKIGVAIDTIVSCYEKKKNKKNKIADFPPEIVEKMLEYQEKEQGKRCIDDFKNSLYGGFSWMLTPEGYDFWRKVIKKKNFKLFFEKYPNKLTENENE